MLARTGAMLSRRAPLVASRQMRQLSVLNVSAVQDSISQMKADIDKPAPLAYTPDQARADADAGKLDVGKIGELFNFMPDDTKKEAMKMASEINRMKREARDMAPVDFDWAALEASTGDSDYVAVMKSTFEAEMKIFQDSAAVTLDSKPAIEKQIGDSFRKSGGLFASAAAIETQAEADQAKLVQQLEDLESQMTTVEDVTIAELLERDPEMRAEVEAEIAAHNWAP